MPPIYRKTKLRFGSDYDVRTGVHIDTDADILASPTEKETDDAKWAPVRRTKPINVLLPATQRWLDVLAPDLTPQALATQFPRLANHLAADWSNPNACRAFLYHLLVDRRGGRKGFPDDVLRYILALRALYAEMHPADEGVGVHRRL
jgi:hypothetical protein